MDPIWEMDSKRKEIHPQGKWMLVGEPREAERLSAEKRLSGICNFHWLLFPFRAVIVEVRSGGGAGGAARPAGGGRQLRGSAARCGTNCHDGLSERLSVSISY